MVGSTGLSNPISRMSLTTPTTSRGCPCVVNCAPSGSRSDRKRRAKVSLTTATSGESREHLLLERPHLRGRPVLNGSERDLCGGEVVRVEAEVDLMQLDEAAN